MTNTISDLCIEIESILQSDVFKTNILNTNENSNLSASDSSNNDQSITSSQIRLPVLQLKTFDGDMFQCISFFNLFNTTVDRK